jgi:hypothetical protein
MFYYIFTDNNAVKHKLHFVFEHRVGGLNIIHRDEEGHFDGTNWYTNCHLFEITKGSDDIKISSFVKRSGTWLSPNDSFSKEQGRKKTLKKIIESRELPWGRFTKEQRSEIWSVYHRISNPVRCEVLVDGVWHTTSFTKLQKNDIFTLKFGNKHPPGYQVSIAVGNPNTSEDPYGNKIWGIETIPFTLNNISSTFIKMVAEQFSPDEIMRMIAEVQHEWK